MNVIKKMYYALFV